MSDAQRSAIDERTHWATKQGIAFTEIKDSLVALTVEDFEHQMGPRGIWSWETGQREAEEYLAGTLEQLGKAVKDALMDHIYETRLKR